MAKAIKCLTCFDCESDEYTEFVVFTKEGNRLDFDKDGVIQNSYSSDREGDHISELFHLIDFDFSHLVHCIECGGEVMFTCEFEDGTATDNATEAIVFGFQR